MSRVSGVLDTKVFVAHIPCTVTEDELLQAFDRFGRRLQHFYLADKRNGDHGFAFITFSEASAALLCVESFNGERVFTNCNRPLRVQLACEKIFSGKAFEDAGKHVPSASWLEYKTDEGFFYYHNSETGETVWEKPANFLQPLQAAEARSCLLGERGANFFATEVLVQDIEQFGKVSTFQKFDAFTFVAFEDSDAGERACSALHGKIFARSGELSS